MVLRHNEARLIPVLLRFVGITRPVLSPFFWEIVGITRPVLSPLMLGIWVITRPVLPLFFGKKQGVMRRRDTSRNVR